MMTMWKSFGATSSLVDILLITKNGNRSLKGTANRHIDKKKCTYSWRKRHRKSDIKTPYTDRQTDRQSDRRTEGKEIKDHFWIIPTYVVFVLTLFDHFVIQFDDSGLAKWVITFDNSESLFDFLPFR